MKEAPQSLDDLDAVDVLIIGGGLVGLTLGLSFQDLNKNLNQPLKILLVDQKPPAEIDPNDHRTLALSFSSVKFLKALQGGEIWDRLQSLKEGMGMNPIEHLHISEAGTGSLLRLHAKDYQDYEETDAEAFGYVVPIGLLYQILWQILLEKQEKQEIEMVCPGKVLELNSVTGEVLLETQKHQKKLKAHMILACDGANSFIRQTLNLKIDHKDYGQSALVTSVQLGQSHENWAFERFLPEGILALLPLSLMQARGGKIQGSWVGVVWVQATEKTQESINLSDQDLLKNLQNEFGHRLGHFLALGPRHTYPLHKIIAKEVYEGRVLLMGNAAHAFNPVGAQGLNLALRDIALLSELVTELIRENSHGLAIADNLKKLFSMYLELRREDQIQIERMTDAMASLYGSDDIASIFMRRSLMSVLRLSRLAREKFVWTLMGKKAYSKIQERKI